MDVNFNVDDKTAALISAVADRASKELPDGLGDDRLSFLMDMTACHANGNPVRWADLLNASKFNFAHDVRGIQKHLCRETGKLKNHFRPRYSA